MGLSIAKWAALAPQISYWVTSAFFESLSYFGLFEQYRVIPQEEDAPKKNQVSKSTVLKYMVTNQALTTIALFLVADYIPMKSYADLPTFEGLFVGIRNPFLQKWAPVLVRIAHLALRQLVAVVVLDTWQFWGHFMMHKIPWLYRHVHSVHHKLYVPYSYAALYNHWAESLIQDDMGGVVAVLVSGLTDWEQVVFYSWVMIKTVEDHAGYELPFSPLIILARYTGAGVTYHNVHHQTWGLKTNFAIYFSYWDWLMSTVYVGNRKLIEGPATPRIIVAPAEAGKTLVVTDAAVSSAVDGVSTAKHRLVNQNGVGATRSEKSVDYSPENVLGLTPDANGNGNLTFEDLLGHGRAKTVSFENKG